MGIDVIDPDSVAPRPWKPVEALKPSESISIELAVTTSVELDVGGPGRRGRSQRWLSWYVAALLALDSLALVVGGLLGQQVRFDTMTGSVNGVSYLPLLLATTPAWLLTLAASGAYERRSLGLGSEEFRCVGNAAARFTAVLAVGVFAFKGEVARGIIALALPACAVFALGSRYLARRILYRIRMTGAASHRVLVVGDGEARDVLAHRLEASRRSGLRVVGACRSVVTSANGAPSVEHVRKAVEALRVDTVAVAHSTGLSSQLVRRLAWSLEGSGTDLLLAPALTDVAGPRINVRPVSGLPLLQIAEPEFGGGRRLIKRSVDLLGTAVLLILLAPLLIVVCGLVLLSGPGPVLFTQIRVGRDGAPFRMLKFRSMVVDAESLLLDLRDHNDHGDGVLFKMRDDPRVTRIGRFLRRYSLDELPQLFNVLRGQMSLVGPRPPLPTEVARYGRDVHRRLLVKPGLTGLWQVNGRSDLDWDEAVRLDLYYVENWSIALDAEILVKTLSAVLRGAGAR